MTITPLLPPGLSPTIISAWLLLHPRVRRGPRLPEKHRGEIFDISFERRLDCAMFSFKGCPYLSRSLSPSLLSRSRYLNISSQTGESVPSLQSLMNQYLIPVLVILASQSLMKHTRTYLRVTNINKKPAKYLSS